MRAIAVLAVTFVLTVPLVRAERVPLSRDQQKAESTHIVTGVVKAVYSREVETTLYGKGTLENHFLLEIEVQGVEKGAGIEKGDIVYVRCWALKKRAQGERIRAFVAKGKYSPTGQEDNGMSLVYPNGIEKLKSK